jgi:hypothetical protein
MIFFLPLSKNSVSSRALVAYICHLSYSEGRDQEDGSSKPAWANSSQDLISKSPSHTHTHKCWWSGSSYRSWLQTPAKKKKKKSCVCLCHTLLPWLCPSVCPHLPHILQTTLTVTVPPCCLVTVTLSPTGKGIVEFEGGQRKFSVHGGDSEGSHASLSGPGAQGWGGVEGRIDLVF